MKVFRFFNIGKANAEIERLESELAAAKAAKPEPAEDHSKALSDAIESNEAVSAQLTQAKADLATAQQTISTLTKEKESLSVEATAITNAIAAALASLKIETKTDATSAEKIEAIADGVSKTLAKLNVKPAAIPNSTPGNKSEAEASVLAKLNSITDPAERVKFIKSLRNK